MLVFGPVSWVCVQGVISNGCELGAKKGASRGPKIWVARAPEHVHISLRTAPFASMLLPLDSWEAGCCAKGNWIARFFLFEIEWQPADILIWIGESIAFSVHTERENEGRWNTKVGNASLGIS